MTPADFKKEAVLKKDFFGHIISDREMQNMLEGKHTKKYKLTLPDDGKTWTSIIMFNPDKKMLSCVTKPEGGTLGLKLRNIDKKDRICECPLCK